MKKTLYLLLSSISFSICNAQKLSSDLETSIKDDDSVYFSKSVSEGEMNQCFGYYSILSHVVRYNAIKCFNYLLENKVDVNKSCEGYVPPLMHAAKYGRLDMVRKLIAKGADLTYVYHGEYEAAKGLNALQYAEKYNQTEVVYYLRSL